MISAIDNKGRSYLALSQANTSSETFRIFIRELVKCLDDDAPRWRENSLLMIDGAAYHTSSHTMELFRELDVPLVVTAPYSYDASPIEFYFATFKRGSLNPNNLPMSKSK